MMDSISVTVFTPNHYWWKSWDDRREWTKRRNLDVWHHRPDTINKGARGFCWRIPRIGLGLNVVYSYDK